MIFFDGYSVGDIRIKTVLFCVRDAEGAGGGTAFGAERSEVPKGLP